MKHSNIKKLTKKVGFVIVILAFIIGFSSFSTAPINMV